MNGRARIITLLLAFAAPCVRAETLYVIEQLIVSVNSAPDGSGERVTQIRSGDRVELLERVGDQAHVRLESGEEGWLKASYLSPDPPLREQLNARTQELERVRKENAQLEAELAKARRAAVEARAAATDPAPSNGTVPTGAGASPSGAPSQSQPAATLSPSPLAAPEATGQARLFSSRAGRFCRGRPGLGPQRQRWSPSRSDSSSAGARSTAAFARNTAGCASTDLPQGVDPPRVWSRYGG